MSTFSLDFQVCGGSQGMVVRSENRIFPCARTFVPCPTHCGVVSSSRELLLMDRIRGNPCFFGDFQTLSDNDAN